MTAQEARERILEAAGTGHFPPSLYIEVAESRCDAYQALLEARASSLVPKDAQWTELDRKTMLEGFTAEKEREYQLLLALEDILRSWVAVGPVQSRLGTG